MATGPCATPPGPVSTTPPCATPTPPATGTTADSTPAAAGRASPATARAAKVKKKFDNKKNQSINQSIDSIPAPRDPVVKVVNHSLIQGSFILFFLGFFGGTGSRSKTRGQLFADQPRHVDPARPAVAQGSTGSGSSDLHPSVPGGRRWGSLASFWFLFGSPLRWLFFFALRYRHRLRPGPRLLERRQRPFVAQRPLRRIRPRRLPQHGSAVSWIDQFGCCC